MRTLGRGRFVKALSTLDSEEALDRSILISASSLRILGFRVFTHFVDLLVQKGYYLRKAKETAFSPRYELEPVPLKLDGFSMRIGTVDGDLCSFRHLVRPRNIYVEVEFRLGREIKLIKIRPHDYVRKDCDVAIEGLIQRFDDSYWQDLYSYHKQIEAIDLGLRRKRLKFGPHKYMEFKE